jgi:hypothetical protein
MFAPRGGEDAEVLERFLASPALAAAWREPLAARRGGTRR